MVLYLMFFQTPLTLVVAFIFMWITIGPACLAGLAVVILLVPTNGYLLVKYVRQIQVTLPCSFHTVLMFQAISNIFDFHLRRWSFLT